MLVDVPVTSYKRIVDCLKNGIQLRFVNVSNLVPKTLYEGTKLRYCKTYLIRYTKYVARTFFKLLFR